MILVNLMHNKNEIMSSKKLVRKIKMNNNSDNFMETDVMENPTGVLASPYVSEKETKIKNVRTKK